MAQPYGQRSCTRFSNISSTGKIISMSCIHSFIIKTNRSRDHFRIFLPIYLVFQVSDSTYDEEACSTVPQVSYEFPNGYRNDFGLERFKISESLFDPSKIRVPQAQTMLSAAHVVTTSVG